MNEKILLLFILLSIGILLVTGCSTIPKEFTLNIHYVNPLFPPSQIQMERDALLSAFEKKDQLLLRAIEKERGDLFKHASYLNLYNQMSDDPTPQGFSEYMMSGVQFGRSGGTFLRNWWERVFITYELYLEMEGKNVKSTRNPTL